jgi:hypothetical protein
MRFELVTAVKTDCGLLLCDVMLSCEWLPVFQRNVSNHLQDGVASQPLMIIITDKMLVSSIL